MALTITLGSGTPPQVLVVIPGTDLTTGSGWTLTASYVDGLGDTQSYAVRGGSGVPASAQVALVDVAAPVNITVTYSLAIDGTVTVTGTTTRTYSGNDLLVGVNGTEAVDFRWIASGGDAREPDVRWHASMVPGSARPPIRLGPVLGAGVGSMVADTTDANTAAMRRLLGKPCHMLHNPANCTIPDCDIPLTELVLIVRAPNDRSSRVDAAHRRWGLSYILISDPEPDYRVPLSTWDEFDAAYASDTWASFDTYWSTRTWDGLDITDWTTVGA